MDRADVAVDLSRFAGRTLTVANADLPAVQERPRLGATEDWRLVNLTEDTHPIHLHLVHRGPERLPRAPRPSCRPGRRQERG